MLQIHISVHHNNQIILQTVCLKITFWSLFGEISFFHACTKIDLNFLLVIHKTEFFKKFQKMLLKSKYFSYLTH